LLALGGVKDPPAVIGFEEPENGIHPRRVRAVAELLKTRASGGDTQIIATTHSPILPDLIPDDSLYACRKTTDGTRIEAFATTPLWRGRDIEHVLNDEGEPEEQCSVGERIMRGDFDA